MSDDVATDEPLQESASINGLHVGEIQLKEDAPTVKKEEAGDENEVTHEAHDEAHTSHLTAQSPPTGVDTTLSKSLSVSRSRSRSPVEAGSAPASSKGTGVNSPSGSEPAELSRKPSVSATVQREETEEDETNLDDNERKKRDAEKVKRALANVELIKGNIYISGGKGRSSEESMPCECEYDPRRLFSSCIFHFFF